MIIDSDDLSTTPFCPKWSFFMTDRVHPIDRRQFAVAAVSTAAAFALPRGLVAAPKASERYKFCAFIKFLTALKYGEMADAIAEAGFDGVEVTARQKESYVHPDRAAEELARLKETLDKRNLEITILTTDIVRADEPNAEAMLRAAKSTGIKRYRLGFFRYDLKKPILPQLAALKPVIHDIAAMNRDIGIAGMWQNHAGADMVGATVWDMHSLIKDYPVSEIGCVFDIRHAAVEAGEAWPIYYDLVKPHLAALSVKDFRWDGRKSAHVPLGKGQVDPKFFKTLSKSDFRGPITVHVEYLPKDGAQANVAALKRDFETLRGWLEG
jgi:sugar phosphate isomerase/epimerase